MIQAADFYKWLKIFGVLTGQTPPPFAPVSASNLILWLDATDPLGNGTQPSNNSLVNFWIDKSGNSNHATFHAAGGTVNFLTNKINNLPVIANNSGGLPQYFSLPNNINLTSTGGLSFYIVYELINSTDTGETLLNLGTDSSNFLSITPLSIHGTGRDLTISNSAGNGIYFYSSTSELGINIPVCDSFLFNGSDNTQNQIRINGVSQTLTTVTSGTAPAFPNTLNFTNNNSLFANFQDFQNTPAYVGEILLFNTAHTSAQASIVENYLIQKWGTLPSSGALLLETGNYILLENGGKILLES